MTAQRVVGLVLSGVILVPSSLLGAEPGFAGAWTLDRERSDPFRRGGEVPSVDMTLVPSEEKVDVSRTYAAAGRMGDIDYVLVTDGEPRELSVLRGVRSARSRWKKDKLVVSYTLSRGNLEMDTTETWKLSKDGKELTITYVSRTAAGDRPITRKEVYVRPGG
jgi:hypothetical protein